MPEIITTTVPRALANCASHAAACCPERWAGHYLVLANKIADAADKAPGATAYATVPIFWDADLESQRGSGTRNVPVVRLSMSLEDRKLLSIAAEEHRAAAQPADSAWKGARYAFAMVCDWLRHDAQQGGLVDVVNIDG